MLKVRIIPLLLLKGSSLVKSVKFKEHRIVGDAVSTIKVFSKRFADEMVILDLDAKSRGEVNTELLRRITSFCNMPLAFGGGIDSLTKADQAFRCGADKIIINSIFFENHKVVEQLVDRYGSQSICLSIDFKLMDGVYSIFTENGRRKVISHDLNSALSLAQEVGVGEILINDIDRDGVMGGLDLDLIRLCRAKVDSPLIVAGGVGSTGDFLSAFELGADAVAAGSIFHWVGESVLGIKDFLSAEGVDVRLV